MSSNSTDTTLHPFCDDWLRVWRCFHAEFPQHNTRAPSLQNHKEECFVSFLELGYSLGYINEGVLQCAYPRCPGAIFEQLVCEKCLVHSHQVTLYCSRLCQIR